MNGLDIGFNALYRPPSYSVGNFIQLLEHHLAVCVFQNEVLVGDINNIKVRVVNADSQGYLSVLMGSGFRSYINDSTRTNGTSQSCIHHIMVKTVQSSSCGF